MNETICRMIIRMKQQNYYEYGVRGSTVSIRPYQYECTRNHQNSEVKRAWACLVLGWGTTREQQVLYAIFFAAAATSISTGAGACTYYYYENYCYIVTV